MNDLANSEAQSNEGDPTTDAPIQTRNNVFASIIRILAKTVKEQVEKVQLEA